MDFDTKKKDGFFSKIASWFGRISAGAKAGMISGAALLVCCLIGGVWYFSASANAWTVEPAPSEIKGVLKETAKVSSRIPTSSEEVSSEETSSEEVSSTVTSTAATSQTTGTKATTSTGPNKAVEADGPATLPAFDEIRKANKDVIGQIYLPGTKLNYYVPQTGNNSFYLNHDVYKRSNGYGVPFVDYRCYIGADSQSTNLVIYGHSDDKNGTYLSAIKNYKDLSFYQNHPTIQFNTIYANATYKVIGMFVENVDQKNSFGYHNFIASGDSFNTGTGLDEFVKQVKGRSYLTMPVDAQAGDHFITLSTCLSTTSRHSRYVLVARKLRDGESASVDTSAATVNANMIQPSGPLN